jgi:hypothetical protein
MDMTIEQQNWFKHIFGDGYDLNDGLDEPDFVAETFEGYRGVRCGSLSLFIMLLTIAINHAASEETDHYELDLPTCGGFDYIINATDGSVFFYDNRYTADTVVIGRCTATAVYDS